MAASCRRLGGPDGPTRGKTAEAKPTTKSGGKAVDRRGGKVVDRSGSKAVDRSGAKPWTEAEAKPLTEAEAKPLVDRTRDILKVQVPFHWSCPYSSLQLTA